MSKSSTVPLSSDQLAILDFWHKIEFFLPFDLSSVLKQINDNPKQQVEPFDVETLISADTDDLWCYTELDPDETEAGFCLYLGVYDQGELDHQLRHQLAIREQDIDKIRLIERETLSQGKSKLSCCAQIRLNAKGCLVVSDKAVQVSTTPWAIGQIQKHQGNLKALDFDRFDSSLTQLRDEFNQFVSEFNRQAGNNDTPLTGDAILSLIQIFQRWIGFETKRTDLPLLYLQRIKEKRKVEKKHKNDANDKQTKNALVESVFDISIMNSFFAKDIANVIRAKDTSSQVLNAYLTPSTERLDLYSADGKQALIDALKPEKLNLGHWFTDAKYHMSLMQQFAINTLFNNTMPLFSVNGPPGTGKTTMLRDMIAQNLVARAEKLAELKRAEDGFEAGRYPIEFNNQVLQVRRLKTELTGFEMVVTSSNNAAVQNISEELPQANALGDEWHTETGEPRVRYLQKVARQILSFTQNQQGYHSFQPLNSAKEPWGLISCVLGNSNNRKRFVDPFINDKSDAENFDPTLYSSIQSEQDDVLSFLEAREIFKEQKEKVKQRIKQLDSYANTHREWHRSGWDNQIAAQQEQLSEAQKMLEQCEQQHKLVDSQLQACQTSMDLLESEYTLLKTTEPHIINKWLNLEKQRHYKQRLEDFYQKKTACNEQFLQSQQDLQKVEQLLVQAKRNVAQEQERYDALSEQRQQHLAKVTELCHQLERHSDEIHTPTEVWIDEDIGQINGLWADQKLNTLRAELFQAALQLHEAWLNEVKNKFKGNLFAINNLLSGKMILGSPHIREESTKLIWQSLFMIVPVVSSTFASFGSLFKNMGAASIGWVFVDEAGQAIPQSAVGALWRAQRAVVVGDPLQIEPVFTTPVDLTNSLAKASDLPEQINALPHEVSVQVLADQANAYGAYMQVNDEPVWIGSPLRVHRRCVNPMFDIANRIAYQGKMVFGGQNKQPKDDPWTLGESRWLNVSASEKQREEEITLACEIFVQLCRQSYLRAKESAATDVSTQPSLPPIYIITPFKEVCEKIRKNVQSNKALWKCFPQEKGYEWVKKNIGTVHTFQGKENSVVLLVLGCDASNIGSATPLVSKPNLLNVAATRAKQRFFIIGDQALWKKQFTCFQQASPLFATDNIDGQEFLANLPPLK